MKKSRKKPSKATPRETSTITISPSPPSDRQVVSSENSITQQAQSSASLGAESHKESSEDLIRNVPFEFPGFANFSDLPALLGHVAGTFERATSSQQGSLSPTGALILDKRLQDDLVGSGRSPETGPGLSNSASLFAATTPSNQQQASASYATEIVRALEPQHEVVMSGARLVAPAKPLTDPASVLVEFYFNETAQLFSCYDGSMNPFRTIVSRLWHSAPLLYLTLQSMAAASLVEDFPHLGHLGKQLRNEAIEMLDNDLRSDSASNSETLLAMLMLGGSASWYDSRDLGLSFFNRVRKTLASVPSSPEQHGIDYQFFHQSMTYWEMLLSYVAETDDLDSSHGPVASEGYTYISFDFIPHPWTGFARDTHHALQKIGRLIRKQRKHAFSGRFTSLAHIKQLEKDMATASELEEYLSSLSYPLENTVVDPEDRNTPVWHLLTLAEAYRLTGLIQLYHIFPDLLDRRLREEVQYDSVLALADTPGSCAIHPRGHNEWLTANALRVLNLIKSIPLESGTRDFQPFILVSLSSELRLAPTPATDAAGSAAGVPGCLEALNSQAVEVSRMRHFVRSRLGSFLHVLPPRPIHVCLDIVYATWKLMDKKVRLVPRSEGNVRGSCEDRNVYWMDVMIENGWETTMA